MCSSINFNQVIHDIVPTSSERIIIIARSLPLKIQCHVDDIYGDDGKVS